MTLYCALLFRHAKQNVHKIDTNPTTDQFRLYDNVKLFLRLLNVRQNAALLPVCRFYFLF